MYHKKYLFRFIIFTFLSFLLLFLWVFPLTGVYFDRLDSTIYYFLNSTLKGRNNWQFFCAAANMRIFDIAYGLLIFMLLFIYMYGDSNSGDKTTPFNKFKSFIVFILLTIIINKILFYGVLFLIGYHRPSPSLAFSDGIRLSKIITSFEFKDASKDCFPGDHATIFICSTIYFFIHGDKKTGLLSCFILLPFILPRLVAGAHWFTDIFVGSFFVLITLFNFWINIPVFKKI